MYLHMQLSDITPALLFLFGVSFSFSIFFFYFLFLFLFLSFSVWSSFVYSLQLPSTCPKINVLYCSFQDICASSYIFLEALLGMDNRSNVLYSIC